MQVAKRALAIHHVLATNSKNEQEPQDNNEDMPISVHPLGGPFLAWELSVDRSRRFWCGSRLYHSLAWQFFRVVPHYLNVSEQANMQTS